jgi:tRNA(fMet)-specific endonuclease VapC
MAVLIDASILIEVERGRLELEPHVAQRPEEEFFLSVITASELLHGVHRALQAEVRTKRAAFVEGILERLPLLPVDLATAPLAERWRDQRVSSPKRAQGTIALSCQETLSRAQRWLAST